MLNLISNLLLVPKALGTSELIIPIIIAICVYGVTRFAILIKS